MTMTYISNRSNLSNVGMYNVYTKRLRELYANVASRLDQLSKNKTERGFKNSRMNDS